MSDIAYKDKGSILNPLKSLGFLGREAVTEALPPRPAADNYRGFHLNDWSSCIGCATCQKICDNAAITMVKVPSLPDSPEQGVRNERPAIDYGRCCWCGLCVDICPTASLALSREYVHTCREDELDSYFILPDPKGIHGEPFAKGWAKTADADLLDLTRREMSELPAHERIRSFDEIVAGYTEQEAVQEASRCVQCGLCHDACPTHMHAPEYIRAIRDGNPEEAVRQMYRTNPFSHVCGRVCTHRCETACSIGRRGEPVAIRYLKRYAMDAVGDDRVKAIAAEGKADFPTGRNIAVIGAGPAGLTAAFDLIRKGHKVDVFEAMDKAGGMTRYGIPRYRLPADRLDADVAVITSLGVRVHYGTRIGVDLSMTVLERDYDAVLLALGLHDSRSTRIPGSDHAGVRSAIDLLSRIARGETLDLPGSVVVIGGGNVAMDIARSLARLQKQAVGKVDVTVVALEDFRHFLADADELKEAREEDVRIFDSRGPKQVLLDENGDLAGLATLGVVSIFDEDGRFAPKYDPADEAEFPAELIVEAIGQTTNLDLFDDQLMERLEWNRGRLAIDERGQTSQPWLWSAGDMVHGPDVVHAVADGHRVADGIDAYLAHAEPVRRTKA